MFGLSTLETYLAVAGLSLLALLGWSAHERLIGEKAIRDADAKALVVAEQKAAAETAVLQAQVNAAQAEASNAQFTLDKFIAAHPTGRVVCNVTPRSPVSQGPGNSSGANGPGTGPNTVSPVSAGTTTTGDIGAGLDAIVQTASRLAVLEHEWQAAIAH